MIFVTVREILIYPIRGFQFVDGPLAMADLKQLDVYTRRIRELTLSDTKSTVHPEVAPETLARLAMIQNMNTPFLSSLECLRVIDVDQALSYLFFCIAPSLRTLEVAGIPSNRQITISAFLKQVVIEVPQLSNSAWGSSDKRFAKRVAIQ